MKPSRGFNSGSNPDGSTILLIDQPRPDGTFDESTTTPRQKKEATAYVYNQAYDSEGMESENTN